MESNGKPAWHIRRSSADERALLLNIWLRSVRATHDFLTEGDIEELVPIVRDHALPSLDEVWVLCSETCAPIGFMGLSDRSIEALFISPENLRRGGGRMLIEHAKRLRGVLHVDVNEQNPRAIRFYAAVGFQVVGRSPVDAQGWPHPLLHMRTNE